MSPGDLRRLVVTQTPVKDHQLKLVGKFTSSKTTTMGRKLYVYSKPQTKAIAHKITWIYLRRRNLKRETESLIITEHNNAIENNHIKAKIDYALENIKC